MKREQHSKISKYWSMIWVLARTDLKMRYEGSALGIFWVFLKPFSQFLVINYVFSTIFHRSTEHYSIKLLIGLILYNFFQDSTTNGMTSFVSKAAILKKVSIPKWIIVVSSTVHSSIAFLFNLVILFIFLMGYYRIFPSPPYILLFFYYAILLYGVTVIFAFIMAPLYARFRDLNQIWEVLLQVLFFASPIFYPITSISNPVRSFLYINPLTYIMEHSRLALIHSTFTRPDHHIIFLCLFIPAFCFSVWFLRKKSRNLIEKL